MPALLQYFICGVIGIWINIFSVKIPKLKVLSAKANHPFSFREYFIDDWPAIVSGNLCVLLVIMCWNEVIGISPDYIGKYPFIFFATIGFTGSQFVLSLLSVASRKLNNIIDVKSNMSDGIQPPVNAVNAEGMKEITKDIVKADAAINPPPGTN